MPYASSWQDDRPLFSPDFLPKRMIFLCTFQGHPIMILKYMIITRSFAKVWNFIQNTVFKLKIGDELTSLLLGVNGSDDYLLFHLETNSIYFFRSEERRVG